MIMVCNTRSGQELAKHFWSKVDIKEDYECWKWQGAITSSGYGSSYAYGKIMGAHRFAYELSSKHKIPDNLQVLHRCDNKLCCNPIHLFLGTQSDNMRDKTMKGRNRCPQKGLLTAEEIYFVRSLKNTITQGKLAKLLCISVWLIARIWNSDKYICKEGYFVNLKKSSSYVQMSNEGK